MTFPINNQEEFNAAVTEAYGDVAALQGQITTLTGERDAHANTIAELNKQINQHKVSDLRRSIAQKKGLPLEFASRLTGETEKDIGTDADALLAIFKAAKGTAPLFQPGNGGGADPKNAALSETLNELRGE